MRAAATSEEENPFPSPSSLLSPEAAEGGLRRKISGVGKSKALFTFPLGRTRGLSFPVFEPRKGKWLWRGVSKIARRPTIVQTAEVAPLPFFSAPVVLLSKNPFPPPFRHSLPPPRIVALSSLLSSSSSSSVPPISSSSLRKLSAWAAWRRKERTVIWREDLGRRKEGRKVRNGRKERLFGDEKLS